MTYQPYVQVPGSTVFIEALVLSACSRAVSCGLNSPKTTQLPFQFFPCSGFKTNEEKQSLAFAKLTWLLLAPIGKSQTGPWGYGFLIRQRLMGIILIASSVQHGERAYNRNTQMRVPSKKLGAFLRLEPSLEMILAVNLEDCWWQLSLSLQNWS